MLIEGQAFCKTQLQKHRQDTRETKIWMQVAICANLTSIRKGQWTLHAASNLKLLALMLILINYSTNINIILTLLVYNQHDCSKAIFSKVTNVCRWYNFLNCFPHLDNRKACTKLFRARLLSIFVVNRTPNTIVCFSIRNKQASACSTNMQILLAENNQI